MENELTVEIVGSEFKPGRKTDTEIGKILGVKRGDVCPKFCTDQEFTVKLLLELDTHPTTAPTLSGEYVCVFHHDGVVMVTVGCKKESHAVACALHYLLNENKSM